MESKQATRMPEWKDCLDRITREGLDYGKVYTAEFFEKHLKCSRGDIRYSLDISKIRRELERQGYYLSGRGQNGNQYVVVSPNQNTDVMKKYQRAALDSLNRGVILGTNTPLHLLQNGDRIKHEQMLQNMATKLVLMQRTNRMVGGSEVKKLG